MKVRYYKDKFTSYSTIEETFAKKRDITVGITSFYTCDYPSKIRKSIKQNNNRQTMSYSAGVTHEPIILIDKSAFLLDFLEIGSRKYTEMRRTCRTDSLLTTM